MGRPVTQGLAGLFAYQSGSVYVNYPAAEVFAQRDDHSRLTPHVRWTDLLPLLTYWHEVDHFCNYITSPYFQAVGWVMDRYASRYTQLWIALQERGITFVPVPLAAHLFTNELPGEIEEHIVDQIWVREMINHALFAHPLEELRFDEHFPLGHWDFASRFDRLVKMAGLGKGVGPGDWLVPAPLPSREPIIGFSAVAVLEASAMFHESGNLVSRGMGPQQYTAWVRERLVGIYSRVFRPLLEFVDVDVIGLLTKFSMRSPYFPYLGADSRRDLMLPGPGAIRLDEVHPVLVLQRGLHVLEQANMLRAPESLHRDQKRVNEFHETAAELLLEELRPVTSAEAFDRTDDILFESFKAGAPHLVAEYEPFMQERALIARERGEIFDLERDDVDAYFRGPAARPLRTVYSDGVWEGEDAIAETFTQGHEAQASSIGIGEAVVLGDATLLEILTATTWKTSRNPPKPRAVVSAVLGRFGLDWGRSDGQS